MCYGNENAQRTVLECPVTQVLGRKYLDKRLLESHPNLAFIIGDTQQWLTDNARPQYFANNHFLIQKLGGIELLSRPALILRLQITICFDPWPISWAEEISKLESVEVGLTEFFASKTRDWYRRGIINLAARWLKAIQSDGLYSE